MLFGRILVSYAVDPQPTSCFPFYPFASLCPSPPQQNKHKQQQHQYTVYIYMHTHIYIYTHMHMFFFSTMKTKTKQTNKRPKTSPCCFRPPARDLAAQEAPTAAGLAASRASEACGSYAVAPKVQRAGKAKGGTCWGLGVWGVWGVGVGGRGGRCLESAPMDSLSGLLRKPGVGKALLYVIFRGFKPPPSPSRFGGRTDLFNAELLNFTMFQTLVKFRL